MAALGWGALRRLVMFLYIFFELLDKLAQVILGFSEHEVTLEFL